MGLALDQFSFLSFRFGVCGFVPIFLLLLYDPRQTYYLSNRILASAADGSGLGLIPASAGPEVLDRFCSKLAS